MMTRAGAAILFGAVLLGTGCEEMGDTLDGALARRDSVPDAAVSRVERQLGGTDLNADTTAASRLSAAFRAAAARALPAVVQITTVSVVDMPSALFRGQPELEEQHRRTQGTGSGFIFDEGGYILTNDHVVQNAVNVRVSLLDGREFTAEVVGTDPSTDVAVIRVSVDEPLPVIDIGDSDRIRVGDWVIALGNPLSLSFTATAGIVSAKERSIRILESEAPLESFIQTDAAINPGNSGGPLVDLNGRVIGINTAIESQTGFFTGAGFAIPIKLAQKVARDLIEYGVVRRPRLGVQIQDISPADAEVYSLPTLAGVEVTSVTPGEAADRAGLQLGDVILRINDVEVHSVADLQARVALFQPGERISLDFIRYGDPRSAQVQLGEFDAARPRQQRVATRSGNPLGFTVATLPPNIAAQLNVADRNTPIVTTIDPFSPAASSGLQRGHAIRRINGEDIRSVRDVQRIAASLKQGEVVSMIVVSPGDADPAPLIVNFRAQ